MDKSWVNAPLGSEKFENGVTSFVDYAFASGKVTENGELKCPCSNCLNRFYVNRDTMTEHIFCARINPNYKKWVLHGEKRDETASSVGSDQTTHEGELRDDNTDTEIEEDIDSMDIDALLHAVYGVPPTDDVGDGRNDEMNDAYPAQFYKILNESKKELYPGCEKINLLKFLVKLWNCKCLCGWSDKSFKMMYELLKESFPDGCTLPENIGQCKKMLFELGLYYNKIDACPNDCMLYWKETSTLSQCNICGVSRYKDESKKTPAKILRHFPLKPRLQRLYMSSKTAADMRWHDEKRTKDGLMRHVADSEAWKHFDKMNPEFAAEPRNVRLGLASDGFNPFKNMSTSYSVWPVVLIPYNMPPWLCMKQPNMILSLLIPGPKGPGNQIDVYLCH